MSLLFLPSPASPQYLPENIVRWCRDDSRQVISDPARKQGAEVVGFGDLAIKHGNVREEEARNQQRAFEILGNNGPVRVPRVHQYFQDGGRGYLVMDRVCGATHPNQDDKDSFIFVAHALNQLHSLDSPTPGPLAGGPVRGDLWPSQETNEFEDVKTLEIFLNSRIVVDQNRFTLSDTRMVLCHSDIAPRNVLLQDGRLYLLDWAYAGYWPRSFEICALRRNHGYGNEDGYFCEAVERELVKERPLSRTELQDVDLMMEVIFNYERYSFRTDPQHMKKRRRKRAHRGMTQIEIGCTSYQSSS